MVLWGMRDAPRAQETSNGTCKISVPVFADGSYLLCARYEVIEHLETRTEQGDRDNHLLNGDPHAGSRNRFATGTYIWRPSAHAMRSIAAESRTVPENVQGPPSGC